MKIEPLLTEIWSFVLIRARQHGLCGVSARADRLGYADGYDRVSGVYTGLELSRQNSTSAPNTYLAQLENLGARKIFSLPPDIWTSHRGSDATRQGANVLGRRDMRFLGR